MKKIKRLSMALAILIGISGFAGCAGKSASGNGAATPTPSTEAGSNDQAAAPAASEAVIFTVSTDAAVRIEAVEEFASLVEEKSGGRYKGNVMAANSLGTAADMGQMIQMGTLDFCLNDDMSLDGILDGKLGFAWLPGLVADYEEADKYYNYGWIAEQVAQIMRENNIVRISSFCNGFRQVGNIKHEITTMQDIAGLKIRTPSVPSVVSFYEKCGAMPVMIAGSEVLSALQTGTVDGLDNAVFNYVNQGITDVIKYITTINYCYSGGCFVASPTFWDKLSPEDQALFAECAQEASDNFTKRFRDETEAIMQEGIEKGQWVVSEPTAEMVTALQEIYQEIWDESRTEYPAEIMDAIISGEYKTLSEGVS